MSNIGTAINNEQAAVSISPMTEHDLLEVVEIEEASGLSRWGWEAYHAELQRQQETIMLVARQQNTDAGAGLHRVVGFVAVRLSGEELHLNNMAVRENLRRQRVGAHLLGATLAEGKQRGARYAFLEVRASNVAAQALYKSFGFQPTARRPGYYSDPQEDAIVMTATL